MTHKKPNLVSNFYCDSEMESSRMTSRPYVLLFATLVTLQVAQCCPDFWTTFEGSCYALIETPATWAEAEELCSRFNSHLAAIESTEENTFIKNFLRSKKHLSQSIVDVKHSWIGGNDLLMEGNWVWSNSGKSIKDFSDWCSGEPDDLHGQDCMTMTLSSGSTFTCNWQWDDEACAGQHSFLCEQPDSGNNIVG